MDCVFCKIASGEIKSDIIYEDDDVIAFNDQNPQAPIHFLVIPKKHIESADALSKEDSDLLGKIFAVIQKITKDLGVNEKGYRIVSNVGSDGGQSVPHLHFHVMAGRVMEWPAG